MTPLHFADLPDPRNCGDYVRSLLVTRDVPNHSVITLPAASLDAAAGAHRLRVSLVSALHNSTVVVSRNHVTATDCHASWCSVVQEIV